MLSFNNRKERRNDEKRNNQTYQQFAQPWNNNLSVNTGNGGSYSCNG